MAGHYRVAAPDAQLGQPEVKVGIIPGAAGNVSVSPAWPDRKKPSAMCAEAPRSAPKEALKVGIVDRLIGG